MNREQNTRILTLAVFISVIIAICGLIWAINKWQMVLPIITTIFVGLVILCLIGSFLIWLYQGIRKWARNYVDDREHKKHIRARNNYKPNEETK